MKDVNLLIQNGVDIEKSLELFGDMATYDETLEEFLRDINEKLKNLQNYKEIADMGNYSILVHSLKSDAKYFGFMKLADLCYQHELESKANNIYFIYEHYDELMEEMKQMLRVVKEYLGKETVVELERETPVMTNTKTILVVDDSNVIQSFIRKIFQNQYQVLLAKDGEEALQMIHRNPNIVAMLLDLNMPNVNGFAVLNYFKEHDLFSKIPVSIITGVGNDEIVKQAQLYPIVDVLRKPFNERDIKIAVEKITQ